ncbi:MAG TPA: hypothetical protein VHL79_09650 [Ramlibacter sp.]|jgi:hypothetical protein|nr:hypothetical protein [Ramlibacter sp.]
MTATLPRQLLISLALALPAAHCVAAGGHHAVDDAAILDKGDCEVETWFSRAAGAQRLLHAGLNCGVGLVELGAAAEYARADGASQTGWLLQAKTARALTETLSVGASLTAGWLARSDPRFTGSTLLALASWQATDAIALHLNIGRDFVHRADDTGRGGVAIEWSPAKGWSLLAERYREQQTHLVRAGARWSFSERLQLDFSRSHRISGPNPGTWTLGATLAFE